MLVIFPFTTSIVQSRGTPRAPTRPPKPLSHLQGHSTGRNIQPPHPGELRRPTRPKPSPAILSAAPESHFTGSHPQHGIYLTNSLVNRTVAVSPMLPCSAPDLLHRRRRAPHRSRFTDAAVHTTRAASLTLPCTAPDLLHRRPRAMHRSSCTNLAVYCTGSARRHFSTSVIKRAYTLRS